MFSSVYILVSFKMPFHCVNKMIPSEISMSGDYLRLKNLPGPRGFDQRIYSVGGGRLDRFLKICPGFAREMAMLGID